MVQHQPRPKVFILEGFEARSAFCGLSPCFRPTKTKTTKKTDQLFEYNFRSLANGKGFLCFYNLT